MLTDLLKPGYRVELQAVEGSYKKDEEPKPYESKLYDILSEDQFEIVMPMEKGKIILLSVDTEYNIRIYTDRGPYQCYARIYDRYKTNNTYLLAMELTSNLQKFQRREYYRLDCALELSVRILTEAEKRGIVAGVYDFAKNLPLQKGVGVDISGGGIRFLSREKYETGDALYLSYSLIIHGQPKKYELAGNVLNVKKSENRPGVFEYRVQYITMDEWTREEIIKYIFEEERKHRRVRV